MTYIRYKTIKGRTYAYKQTSVRKGKKVKTISEYLGALGWIAVAAISPGKPGGYKGHKSTDARANKHQEQADRERFDKEMENPRARFVREVAKTGARHQNEPKAEVDASIREFNEARQNEKSKT